MIGRRPLNAQYNVNPGGGMVDRVSTFMRRRMYARFVAAGVVDGDRLLDVGVTSDRAQLASNYLEAWYPHKDRIVACGIDDAAFLEQAYPGLRFVRGDGRALPFADRSVDWVHSSAVLEHVGGAASQAAFIAELFRVCRKGIFVTTPNRWFPVEFHTTLPVLHWLPVPWFRALLARMGHDALALEENLNLLGRRDIERLCISAGLRHRELGHVRLGGWPSNLLLVARRHAAADR